MGQITGLIVSIVWSVMMYAAGHINGEMKAHLDITKKISNDLVDSALKIGTVKEK